MARPQLNNQKACHNLKVNVYNLLHMVCIMVVHNYEKTLNYIKNIKNECKLHIAIGKKTSKTVSIILRPTNIIIADFGCGEAKLAQSLNQKVHSFDLVALNDLVIQCDMKNVPLNNCSCDLVVFCLSLMGTNLNEFICEAHRVLKSKYVKCL